MKQSYIQPHRSRHSFWKKYDCRHRRGVNIHNNNVTISLLQINRHFVFLQERHVLICNFQFLFVTLQSTNQTKTSNEVTSTIQGIHLAHQHHSTSRQNLTCRDKPQMGRYRHERRRGVCTHHIQSPQGCH